MAVKAEYLWVDGTQPTAKLRSKTKIVPAGEDPVAQHLCIYEETDDIFYFNPVAVGNRDADANILLSGIALQQSLEARQQCHEEGRTLALGLALQANNQRGRQHKSMARGSIIRRICARCSRSCATCAGTGCRRSISRTTRWRRRTCATWWAAGRRGRAAKRVNAAMAPDQETSERPPVTGPQTPAGRRFRKSLKSSPVRT